MTEDGKLDLGDLKAMSCPTISNTMAAEVLKMDPARLAFYARTGQLGWKVLAPENGSRVIHNREDFIRYWTGEQKEPDPPERPTTEQLLNTLLKHVMFIEKVMICMMDNEQRQRLQLVIVDEEKTACAATQTVRKDWGNEQP